MSRFDLVAMTAVVFSVSALAQGLKVELRCPPPCTFRQGESIWLNVDYTANTPFEYEVRSSQTDRENASDEFVVTPREGTSDPIAPYLRVIRVQGGSSAVRQQAISQTPVTVRMNLNQWVRFDQPGTYHVSTISHRVSDGSRAAPRPPASNEVEIKILPADPQWQREQLRRILQVLNGNPRIVRGQEPDEIRELCNLGTEAAAIEMARRMGDDPRTFWLYEFGLIRSPYRAAGIAESERLLVDPDAPVSLYFFTGLANISLDPVSDPAQLIRQAQAKRAEVRQRVIDALPLKRGQAKTISEEAVRR